MAGFEDKNYSRFEAKAKKDIPIEIKNRAGDIEDHIIAKGEIIICVVKRRDGSPLYIKFNGGKVEGHELMTSFSFILDNCKNPNKKFLGIF